MRAGDYFTVGESTVVQFDRLTGDRVHLTINAPREVPILRGDVLERTGGSRPGCVMASGPRYVKQLPWNPTKKRALQELRQTLDTLADSPETRAIRAKLDVLFPQSREAAM